MTEPIESMRDVWRIYYPFAKKDKDGNPIVINGELQIDEEWIKNNPQENYQRRLNNERNKILVL